MDILSCPHRPMSSSTMTRRDQIRLPSGVTSQLDVTRIWIAGVTFKRRTGSRDLRLVETRRRVAVAVDVLGDTIQPFPSFSGIYYTAVKALRMNIADIPPPVGPMDAQMANMSE